MSAFYGIVITMYSDEGVHAGRPHFHAEYAGLKASYDIRTLKPVAGRLHPRANRLVVEWASAPVRVAAELAVDAGGAAAQAD